MKAKYIVMLVVCAVLTLSFTVVSSSHSKEKAKRTESTSASASFVGGIASDDPIK